MSRYIDADAIPYTMLYKENWLKGTGVEAQGVFKSDIDNMPTIEERKTGKWLRTEAWPHRIYCSACFVTFIRNDEFLRLGDIPHNYCPHCGARMENADD